MIRVFVADDHPIVRQGILRIVEEAGDMKVSGQASDGVEALRLLRAGGHDVAVLDIQMEGMSGLEVLDRVHEELPGLRVLILSMHEEERYALRALKSGAMGYLTKRRAPEDLLEAIRSAHRGRIFVTASLAERLAALIAGGGGEPTHEVLSNRELSVLLRIARGMSLDEIGRELHLSAKTVSTYRSRVLQKLGLDGNAALVRYAVEHGLVD